MSMYSAVARSEVEDRRTRISADFDRQRARRHTSHRWTVGSSRSGRVDTINATPGKDSHAVTAPGHDGGHG
jgi:hypothetical protein